MLNNITTRLTNINKNKFIFNRNEVYHFNPQSHIELENNIKQLTQIILYSFFKKFGALCTKPIFTFNNNKLSIHISYYKLNNLQENSKIIKNKNQALNYSYKWEINQLRKLYLKNLINLLTSILSIPVELEIVRLKHPSHDANILAQFLGIWAKQYTYRKMKEKLFENSNILTKQDEKSKISAINWNVFSLEKIKESMKTLPFSILDINKLNSYEVEELLMKHLRTYNKNTTLSNNLDIHQRENKISILTGLKIRVAGRIAKQRVIPKKTVNSGYTGSIAKTNNNLVDSASFTHKSKRGAFTIRVWVSHGIKNIH
jgi:hypothetical protein